MTFTEAELARYQEALFCGHSLEYAVKYAENPSRFPIKKKETPIPGSVQEVDPNGIGQHDPGAKLDRGKTRAWLFLSGFPRALEQVARVTTVGAEKYSPNGWASVENGFERYMDAASRHELELAKGVLVDAETGLLHLAQVVWNHLAALELMLREKEKKDGATPQPPR